MCASSVMPGVGLHSIDFHRVSLLHCWLLNKDEAESITTDNSMFCPQRPLSATHTLNVSSCVLCTADEAL